MYRARRVGLDPEVILSLAVWLVISGFIGARLFYVIEYWNEKFVHQRPLQTLLDIVNVPEGGLVIYGGFIGAVVGMALFVRKQNLPLLAIADLIAPSMMVGLALGRVGCFLNGCCYGGPTDWPWAVTFPQSSAPFASSDSDASLRLSPPYADQASRGELHGFRIESRENQPAVVVNVLPESPAATAGLQTGDVIDAIDGHAIDSAGQSKQLILQDFLAERPLQLKLKSGKALEVPSVAHPPRSRPVHPTQLYSAIDAGILAWLLWSYYPFRRRDGEALALLLTIHPITRFLLEIIRTDEPAVFGTGLSISQNISVLLLVVAGILWWYLSRQRRGVAIPLAAKPANPPRSTANSRRAHP
jgi:phosphatidylglycerol:prolipoprotein diacylglycerol transferase